MVREKVAEELSGKKGRIINFRIGNRNPRHDQLILDFELPEGIKSDDLIGLHVKVKLRQNEFTGKIYKKHGNSHVRARFPKPLPGQVVLPGEANVEIL